MNPSSLNTVDHHRRCKTMPTRTVESTEGKKVMWRLGIVDHSVERRRLKSRGFQMSVFYRDTSGADENRNETESAWIRTILEIDVSLS